MPSFAPPSKAQIRGRQSRARGVRFERYCARKLRDMGYEVRRVLEYDGYSHGVDLIIGAQEFNERRVINNEPLVCDVKTTWLPIAIQCKSTQKEADLETGLAECRAGAHEHQLWVCIHAYHEGGRRRSLLRIKLQHAGEVPRVVTSFKEIGADIEYVRARI